MSFFQLIILAIIQGLAELLSISSSAHVVVAEKLMGLNPSAPEMTLILVMLHTGTMFAVIVYFWNQWRRTYFESAATLKHFVWLLVVATALTGIIGELVIKVIEKTIFRDVPHAEVEDLFSHLELIAPALAAAGILILVAGLRRQPEDPDDRVASKTLTTPQASVIGAIQGLCLPFRGFSRSGATISTGMLAGVSRLRAETFSFALAVVLTPIVVGREVLRLQHAQQGIMFVNIGVSLAGAVFAFLAGLLALKWLSRWLEAGRWHYFGIYCLVAAVAVFILHRMGY
ncbi:MAG: undecaprenyl-diphosphate phosphatase [Acidobacteriaceae bacterium]|nr:undecaprenyl-diphosphate phosphatase [Acidobacteriaceae bacterium]